MMGRIFVLAAVVASASAQPNRTRTQPVWFQDGTCLEVYTQSTGSTPLHSDSVVVRNEANVMLRLVEDEREQPLFGYDVEARAGSSAGTFFIRIGPHKSAGRLPTVASVREFPAVKNGEAVIVDILQNPATGEKIFDVLRPSDLPEGDAFSLRDPVVTLNGQWVKVASGPAAAGGAIQIYLPGHGSYFLALEPSPGYPFRQAADVYRDTLAFAWEGDRVEIACRSRVLTKSERRMVWLYKDPGGPAPPSWLAANTEQQQRLLNQQRYLEALLQRLSRTYTPMHPEIRSTQARLEVVRKQIAEMQTLPAVATAVAGIRAAADVDALLKTR